MNFICPLFNKINLNYVVFVLKTSHSQSYLRCVCMCFIIAETDQYQGSLEDLPFQILSIYYNQILNANFSTFYLLGFFRHKK